MIRTRMADPAAIDRPARRSARASGGSPRVHPPWVRGALDPASPITIRCGLFASLLARIDQNAS